MARLSDSFAGSSTRSMDDLEKEIEYRLGKLKHMDVFTEDFSPPGVSDVVSGQDVSRSPDYGKPHDDSVPRAEKGFVRGAAAGKASDQVEYDKVDEEMRSVNAKIKPQRDQFPGAKMDESKFSGEVEKRMKRLAMSVERYSYKGYEINITKSSDGFKASIGLKTFPKVFSSQVDARAFAADKIDSHTGGSF